MLSICVGGVQHPRMAQGMLLPVRGSSQDLVGYMWPLHSEMSPVLSLKRT